MRFFCILLTTMCAELEPYETHQLPQLNVLYNKMHRIVALRACHVENKL